MFSEESGKITLLLKSLSRLLSDREIIQQESEGEEVSRNG